MPEHEILYPEGVRILDRITLACVALQIREPESITYMPPRQLWAIEELQRGLYNIHSWVLYVVKLEQTPICGGRLVLKVQVVCSRIVVNLFQNVHIHQQILCAECGLISGSGCSTLSKTRRPATSGSPYSILSRRFSLAGDKSDQMCYG